LSGRVVFDGTREKPTTDQLIRATIVLDPADGRSTGTFADARGQIDATGQFKTTGIVPGKYLLRVNGVPADWTLKSADSNGRDIADEPLVVDSGDITGAVITFTDHPAELSGSVRDAAGAIDPGASVLIFPADRTRWTDAGRNPRSERLVRPSSIGTFTARGLPPGNYFVLAVDDAQLTQGWSDPKFLDTLSRSATRITIADGEKKTQDLRTVKIQ
jgi:hypothetical protein